MGRDFYKEREKDIAKAGQAAISKARAECRAKIEDAYLLEKDTIRKSQEAVEGLKQQLKSTKDKQEKKALKNAVKEAESNARKEIAKAKKLCEEQVSKARAVEKEAVSRIQKESEQAIKGLRDEVKLVKAAGNRKAAKKTGPAEIPEGYIKAGHALDNARKFDGGNSGKAFNRSGEIKAQLPGGAAFKDDSKLKDVLPQSRGPEDEIQFKSEVYDQIRKELEESISKFDKERKTGSTSELDYMEEVPSANSGKAIGETDVSEDSNSCENTGDVSPNGNACVAGGEQVESPGRPDAAEGVKYFEGRVKIIVENPSSSGSITALWETLKQVEDIKIILFGGTAEAGVQIIILAYKPVELISRLKNIPGVDVESSSTREIRLKAKQG